MSPSRHSALWPTSRGRAKCHNGARRKAAPQWKHSMTEDTHAINCLKFCRLYFSHMLSKHGCCSGGPSGCQGGCDRLFDNAAGAVSRASHAKPRHQVLPRTRHRTLRLPLLPSLVVVIKADRSDPVGLWDPQWGSRVRVLEASNAQQSP